jgi:hypothetical protein
MIYATCHQSQTSNHTIRIDDLNMSIPSCAGELGRGEERTEVVDGVCPTPGPQMATSPKSSGNGPILLSAVPPSRSGVMGDAAAAPPCRLTVQEELGFVYCLRRMAENLHGFKVFMLCSLARSLETTCYNALKSKSKQVLSALTH